MTCGAARPSRRPAGCRARNALRRPVVSCRCRSGWSTASTGRLCSMRTSRSVRRWPVAEPAVGVVNIEPDRSAVNQPGRGACAWRTGSTLSIMGEEDGGNPMRRAFTALSVSYAVAWFLPAALAGLLDDSDPGVQPVTPSSAAGCRAAPAISDVPRARRTSAASCRTRVWPCCRACWWRCRSARTSPAGHVSRTWPGSVPPSPAGWLSACSIFPDQRRVSDQDASRSGGGEKVGRRLQGLLPDRPPGLRAMRLRFVHG